MFPAMLALGALSAAGSVMSGMGNAAASKKQMRYQLMADQRAHEHNLSMTNAANAHNEEMLAVQNRWKDWAAREIQAAADPVQMRRDAERAGFNPVSWLQMGGAAARLSAVVDSFNMMEPDYILMSHTPMQASQIPAQSSPMQAWGAGLSAFASTAGTQLRADMSYDLQMGKMAMQTAGSFFGGMQSPYSMGGGTGGGYGGTATTSGGLSSSQLGWPDINSWKPGKVEVTAWSPFAPVDKYAADVGGAVTQRLGEPGEWLFFGPTLASDILKRATGKGFAEWGIANGANIGGYSKPGDAGIWPSIQRWYNDPATSWAWPLGNLPSPQAGKEGYGSWNTPPLFPGAIAY